MTVKKKPYNQLKKLSTLIALQNSIHSLLDWDQELNMPAQGIELRSHQITWIASQTHINGKKRYPSQTLQQDAFFSSTTPLNKTAKQAHSACDKLS